MDPWVQIALLVSATMISEDLACISAGLWARAGQLDLFVAVIGCVIGIYLGDWGLWLAGRLVGRRVLSWRWIARRVSAEHVDRFGRSFDRHMGKAVFGSRFLPGTRVPLFLAAGVASRRPLAFAGWLLFAVVTWTPLLIVLAMALGPVVARPFEAIAGVGWIAWILVALLLLAALRSLALAASWRGRVRLAAAISRLWRPEFWPAWLFYLPLLPWLALLAACHRGITTPTAANPAMPHGGFVGESKYRILSSLPPAATVPSHLAVPAPMPQRLHALREHVDHAGWDFPLVLKPDAGQRGAGVKLARCWTAVEDYLGSYELPVLVQPYDPGPYEAGIFYYRFPGQARGRIFSVTDKRFPAIVGDGRSTLEQLILRDRRLRMQAGVFLRRHASSLLEVPAAGERRPLGIAGNHCQGTMFLDGSHLATPALERAIDAVAASFPGFCFGRFDVRYASAERLSAGEGFRIVELNGMTSESTNVYDPSFGVLRGWLTLGRQWSLAFRIGAANRRLGHPVSTVGELWRAARRHYRDLPRGVSD